MPGAPPDVIRSVPLFVDLTDKQVAEVARLFKRRKFAAGDTVIREGSGGAAFFLIESGDAVVSVRGEERAQVGAGHAFGELAMIDEGPRSATITASTDLVCWGLTYWDFRPLVEANGPIGWRLLHTLATRLRAADQAG